jgi:2-dehydro-3-deoxygluconokinase
VLDRLVKHVDVLVGNEEDLQMGLGIPGPEASSKSKLDPHAFIGMIDTVAKKHPQIKVVATTLREVHSTNRHTWAGVAWINGKTYLSPTCELDVLDRVGGGDGFAAGLFYGCSTANLSKKQSISAGRTEPCSRPFQVIPRWRLWNRFAILQKAVPRAFNGSYQFYFSGVAA